METFLRRHLLGLDLLVLATAALLVARATAHAVDARLLALCGDEEAGPAQPRAVSFPATEHRVDEIVRRNVFCSACRPAARVGSGHEDEEADALPLRLLAVMFAAPPADPRLSLAVMKDQQGASGAYTVGSRVGTALVEAIDETHVSLRLPDGHLQRLTLLEGEPAGSARAREASADPLAAELEAGIERRGENRYGVRRDTLESLLGKLDTAAPQARLEPDVRDGKPAGFRLRDVKEGGVFAKIGLREGDLISSVNGLTTNGPDHALAIYASLRSADHLSVEVERAGRRITAEYDIE